MGRRRRAFGPVVKTRLANEPVPLVVHQVKVCH